jgi:hypothetical protein
LMSVRLTITLTHTTTAPTQSTPITMSAGKGRRFR